MRLWSQLQCGSGRHCLRLEVCNCCGVYVCQHALLCHLCSVLVVVVARVHIGGLKVALNKSCVVSFRASECSASDINMCRDVS